MEARPATECAAQEEPRSSNRAQTREGISSVGQRLDLMCDAAQETWTLGRDALEDFRVALDLNGRIDRNPYAMVAAALGTGYVLGGGLFAPLTGRVLTLGIRLATIPFIQRKLLGLGAPPKEGSETRYEKTHPADAPNGEK